MSEEKNDQIPNDQPSENKKPKPMAPKKPLANPFLNAKNRFLTPKPGSSKMKGGGFKGGGVKKGK